MQAISEIIQKQNEENKKYLKSKHCQSDCDKCI